MSTVDARPVFRLALSVDGQGIHVGAQPYPTLRRPTLEDTDDPGPAHPGFNLYAKRGEKRSDSLRGLFYIELDTRSRVELTTPTDHFIVKGNGTHRCHRI
jgi:hypothetical protein